MIMVSELFFIGLIVFLSGSRIAAQPLATPASRMAAAGIQLPEPNRPIGNYVTWVRTGDLLFLSGHGSCGAPGPVDRGKLGQDLDIGQGYQAARNVGLCMLATLQDALGDLARVKRVVRGERHGQCHGGFYRPSKSDERLFGPDGRGIR
jgi:hypothetical protein